MADNRKLVEVIEKKEVKFNKPIAIAGFAGPGLVGTIAVNYIIEKLGMREIGHISSRLVPSYTIFIDGLLKYPLRAYSDDEGTLLAIVSDIPIPEGSYYDLAKGIMDWVESKKISEIVVLGGVHIEDKVDKMDIYAAAEPEVLEKLGSQGIKILARGIISGMSAAILNECLLRDITGICLLAPTDVESPDPEASASLIEALNAVYGFKIEVDTLVVEAENIKDKREKVVKNIEEDRKYDFSKQFYS